MRGGATHDTSFRGYEDCVVERLGDSMGSSILVASYLKGMEVAQ
jgi:hypothetical protein